MTATGKRQPGIIFISCGISQNKTHGKLNSYMTLENSHTFCNSQLFPPLTAVCHVSSPNQSSSAEQDHRCFSLLYKGGGNLHMLIDTAASLLDLPLGLLLVLWATFF